MVTVFNDNSDINDNCTYRKDVIHQYKQVLDGMILADMCEQVQEDFSTSFWVPVGQLLHATLVQVHNEVMVTLSDHLRPNHTYS